MGMLMSFYVGDKNKIGEGFSSNVKVPLWKQPFVLAMADFSLHLSPIDLDLLSEEMCRIAGAPQVALTDSLVENVGGNGHSSSADAVSPMWVEMVAGISDQQIDELARGSGLARTLGSLGTLAPYWVG